MFLDLHGTLSMVNKCMKFETNSSNTSGEKWTKTKNLTGRRRRRSDDITSPFVNPFTVA